MASKKPVSLFLLISIVVFFFLLAMAGIVNKNKQKLHAASSALAELKIDGTILPLPRFIADFNTVATNTNGSFTKHNLVGHWTMMFFGFTNCAFVCPTTLAELNKMYILLQKNLKSTELPQVVMVSVDPDRDTIPRFASYLAQFNKSFIGLRASAQQLAALAAQMNVTYSKIVSSDGNPQHYTMTHSAEVMLLDPNGNLRAFLSYPHQAQQMAQDYEAIINAVKK